MTLSGIQVEWNAWLGVECMVVEWDAWSSGMHGRALCMIMMNRECLILKSGGGFEG
jgi:hypothetical protein